MGEGLLQGSESVLYTTQIVGDKYAFDQFIPYVGFAAGFVWRSDAVNVTPLGHFQVFEDDELPELLSGGVFGVELRDPLPIVASTAPLNAQITSRQDRIEVYFNGPLDPATAFDLANYDLRAAGLDGDFNSPDDVTPPFVVGYDPTSFLASLLPAGDVIQVADGGERAEVGIDAAGAFVVVWEDDDGSVSGQLFSPDGQPAGPTFNLGEGSRPAVARAADGSFVVVLLKEVYDSPTNTFTSEIRGQLFSAAGTPTGDDLILAAGTMENAVGASVFEPRVAIDALGNFVVAWSETTSDDDPFFYRTDVKARVFDRLGAPLTGVVQATPAAGAEPQRMSLAMSGAGQFVVAWLSDDGVLAQRFDAAATALGAPIQVADSADEPQRPFVAMNPAGEFAIGWTTSPGIGPSAVVARTYDAHGVPRSSIFQIDEGSSDFGGPDDVTLGMEPGGSIVASLVVDEQRVMARRFSGDGVPLGPAMSFTGLDDPFADIDRAFVAVANSGDFVLAWSSDEGILARQYLASAAFPYGQYQLTLDGSPPPDGLQTPNSAATSPDGAYVYVTADYEGLATFRRDPVTGELTPKVVVRDGVGGVDGLGGATALAMSSDGRHLYVVGSLDNALAVFSRDEVSGALTFVQTVADGVGGVEGLAGANAVTLSPDGAHVYATGPFDGAIAAFARNAATGELAFVDDVGEGVEYPRALVVSPDGQHVYAIDDFGALAIYARNAATGGLTLVNVVTAGITNPTSLAVSPDGGQLLVSVNEALAVYNRNGATGELILAQLLSDGVAGVDGLAGVTSITLSPDGEHVYVTSAWDGNAAAIFDREPVTRMLSFVEVVRGPGFGLSLTISPNGAHAYIGDYNQLWAFGRDAVTGVLTPLQTLVDGIGGLTDPAGVALDGDYDDIAGGDFVVTITLADPTPSGDFNDDGNTDGYDFLAWQRGFGTPAPAASIDGDADYDLDVDSDDLGIWEEMFGASTAPAPATLALTSPVAALSPAMADAAMAYQQMLADAANPRSRFRPRVPRL
jgi:6-phosphogluconolactonase (cycloisomerase 2 family)